MTIMTRLIALILFAFSLMLLIGCNEQSRTSSRRPAGPLLTTVAGMAQYLTEMPAVKNVEDWPNDYGTGIVITTDHYEVYTTLLDPLMLRQLPAFMESAHRAYQKQLPYPIDTESKFIVYLFADRQQWEMFTKTFTGPQWPMYLNIKKGAYYLNGACVAYNIGRTRTFSVLGHEGWHQFNSRHFAYRLPSWLDEGIAMLFEVSQYDKKGLFEFMPGRNLSRLGALKKTLGTNRMIPLENLIALNPGQVMTDTDATMAFYAQSYALVRFLREDDYGRRLSKFHNILLGALRGHWPLEPGLQRIAADRNIPLTAKWNSFVSPKLFALYIDADINSLEPEYLAFCRKNVYHIRLKK